MNEPDVDFKPDLPTFAYATFEDGTIYALVNPRFSVTFKQDVMLPLGERKMGSQSFPAAVPEQLHPDTQVQSGRLIYRMCFENKCDDKLLNEPFQINGIMFRIDMYDPLNAYVEAEGIEQDFPEKEYEVQCTECPRVYKHYSRHIIPPEVIAKGGICSLCEDDFK